MEDIVKGEGLQDVEAKRRGALVTSLSPSNGTSVSKLPSTYLSCSWPSNCSLEVVPEKEGKEQKETAKDGRTIHIIEYMN